MHFSLSAPWGQACSEGEAVRVVMPVALTRRGRRWRCTCGVPDWHGEGASQGEAVLRMLEVRLRDERRR